MPFQYPISSVTSVSEFLVPGLPYITGSDAFPPNGYTEVSFPRVTSTIKIRNTSPTGSFRIGFTTPAFDTGKYLTIGANSEISLSARAKRLFISGSALTGSFQIVSGLTGISTRELYEAEYSPQDEVGLIVNLDASIVSSLFTNSQMTTNVSSNGDPVGGWQDQSGLGNHLIQSSTSRRGTYSNTGLLNKSAVIFDGVDDYMSSTNILNLRSGTVFVTFSNISLSLYDGLLKIAATFSNASNISGDGLIFYTSSGYVYFANPSTTQFYTQFGTTTTWSGVMNMVYSWDTTIATNVVRKNGTYLSNAGPVIGGVYTQPIPNYVHFPVGYSGNTANIAASQILVYNSQLPLSAIQRVEAYLKNKWGTP